MAILPVYELTVFDDDDTAELFDVSTDPLHARPYLKRPTGFPEQEVDFAKGTASIGQINVQVVDVPTDPLDQDTGYFTAQLAGAAGYSTLNGHRALLTEDLGGGAATVLDGVIRSVRLLDTFTTYELELRDIRERERKAKAFTNTTSPSVFPRGVMDGYGVVTTIPFAGVSFTYPIPPTQPLVAVYSSFSATRGAFKYESDQPNYQGRQILTDVIREAFDSVAPVAAQPGVMIHNRFKVLWRDNVAGGAYTELEQLAFLHPDLPEGGGQPVYVMLSRVGTRLVSVIRVNNEVTADTLPSDTQLCDVIVQYDGPPTKDWQHHIQDVTAGELLRNLYRGDHSDEDPRIRYDETALLALATRVRGRLSGPIEDLRAWAEKNVYPIVHAAPTLNGDGEISPVTYLLPDENESLTDLDDTNCRPTGGGWAHGSEDAVNLVKVTYKRDYRYNPEEGDKIPEGTPLSDLILSRDVIVEHRIQDSIDLLGEQPLEVDSVLLTTVGSTEGGPFAGDTTLETGYQVAKRIQRMATDRFALGGQYFSLFSDRSVAAIEAFVVGTWVTVSVSWMPDYGTQERNLNRLAQIVGRRNHDANWTHLTLVDAGTANAALAAPTLGAVTADAAGVVSIPIASVPAGGEARIEYAVNATEPAAGSELWEFLDRAGVSTLTTPPNPQGSKVWVRARSEATGRRPSAYITAVSVTLTGTARIVDAFVNLDDDGVPRVYWVANEACLGVEIHYERHLVADDPTYADSVEVDVDDANRIMTEPLPTPLGYIFSVQLEPWTGWTGAAVSGTAGPRYEVRVTGVDPLDPLFDECTALIDDNGSDLLWCINFAFLGNVNTTDHELDLSFFKNGTILSAQDQGVSVGTSQPYQYTSVGEGGLTTELLWVRLALKSKATGQVVGATVDVVPVQAQTILNETLYPVTPDVTVGSFTPTPLHNQLDADDANDASRDAQASCPGGTTETFEVSIANPSATPASSATQELRLQGEADKVGVDAATGCAFVDFEIQLIDGTTVIATVSATDIATSTLDSLLSDAEYDAITDHNDLRIRMNSLLGFDDESTPDVTIDVNYVRIQYVAK